MVCKRPFAVPPTPKSYIKIQGWHEKRQLCEAFSNTSRADRVFCKLCLAPPLNNLGAKNIFFWKESFHLRTVLLDQHKIQSSFFQISRQNLELYTITQCKFPFCFLADNRISLLIKDIVVISQIPKSNHAL